MSFIELSKGDRDDISGSLPKYVIDCQSKITVDNPTTDGWLENIQYVQTLKNSGPLVSPNRTNIQILQGVLYGNKKVVVKVSNNSENIEKEFENYKIMLDNNVQGFLNYYCFFVCKDFIRRIREELSDKEDYTDKPNFDKKSPSICRKDGDDMKVLIMEYVEDGSFGLYNWKQDDIEIIVSCVKQLTCSLIDAYIKTGFVHFDLNSNNFVLKKTNKTQIEYNINGRKIKVQIPSNGFETAIMDLEICEINQNINKFVKSLTTLYSSISKLHIVENNKLQSYISDLIIKSYELFKSSENDNTRNIDLAIQILEIF
jgi:tRNA A-37 threonylcarbamoyl transferase component Bud32